LFQEPDPSTGQQANNVSRSGDTSSFLTNNQHRIPEFFQTLNITKQWASQAIDPPSRNVIWHETCSFFEQAFGMDAGD